MSDALSFIEMQQQVVELLPARTVLSCPSGGHGDYGHGSYGPSDYGSGDGSSEATAANYNYNYNYIDNDATGGAATSVLSLVSGLIP
ncbi:MAG TPA: hypothetical protein VFQ77_04950 [Pseudonocardiaceae bacterium]|jgi:hypothetical protein|nr:hypothetical protein [Pseudonocardiaceae bacterium]